MSAKPILDSRAMTIEQFIAQSEGSWKSMRSGHSLAFQQFEEVLSEITIKKIDKNDEEVKDFYQSCKLKKDEIHTIIHPFKMTWSAESDWEPDDPSELQHLAAQSGGGYSDRNPDPPRDLRRSGAHGA